MRQAPWWIDVYLVGYSPDSYAARKPVVVGRRTFEHPLYDADDLLDLGFPSKSEGFPGGQTPPTRRSS